VDPEEWTTRLAVPAKLGRFHIKRPCRPRFVYGDINCADPPTVHAGMCDEISSHIDNCDVQRTAQRLCFLLCVLDDNARVLKV
jgi:hypothetical protein